MFEAKYRIVRDLYCGYEVQRREWWWPAWRQIAGPETIGTNTNSFPTIYDAEQWIKKHSKAGQLVKYVQPAAEQDSTKDGVEAS